MTELEQTLGGIVQALTRPQFEDLVRRLDRSHGPAGETSSDAAERLARVILTSGS